MPPGPWWFKVLAIIGGGTLVSSAILVVLFLVGTWNDRRRERRAAKRAGERPCVPCAAVPEPSAQQPGATVCLACGYDVPVYLRAQYLEISAAFRAGRCPRCIAGVMNPGR